MSEIKIEQIIVSRIQAELSPVQVQLRDMTGTRDHWEAIIITAHFDGMRAIARQQRVYKALGALMAGPIHAFTMTTLTPEEAELRGVHIHMDPAETSSSNTSAQGSQDNSEQSDAHQSGLISLD